MYKRVSISLLRIGAVLTSPIFDDHGTKLLGSDVTITNSLLDRLRSRNVHSVVVDESDFVRLFSFRPQGTSRVAPANLPGMFVPFETDHSREIDTAIRSGLTLIVEPTGESLLLDRVPEVRAYDPEMMNMFVEQHQVCLGQLKDFGKSIISGDAVALDSVDGVTDDVLKRAFSDFDLLVCLGINPMAGDYPTRHNLHVSTLAMAIGANLGWGQKSIKELGLGCLLHDIGMLRLMPVTYNTKRRISDIEFSEIAKHPIYSFEMLKQSFPDLNLSTLMVVYQMHERCNGTGYPRQLMGDQIHEMAKVAAVADAYIALVSTRPHRPGMIPYHAIVKLLNGIRDGLYDSRAVRGLLETACLFPVGSFVTTEDGRVGKVIRSNKENYSRPIVELWSRANMRDKPEIVDLAEGGAPQVIGTLGEFA